jgi:hypothetical protein
MRVLQAIVAAVILTSSTVEARRHRGTTTSTVSASTTTETPVAEEKLSKRQKHKSESAEPVEEETVEEFEAEIEEEIIEEEIEQVEEMVEETKEMVEEIEEELASSFIEIAGSFSMSIPMSRLRHGKAEMPMGKMGDAKSGKAAGAAFAEDTPAASLTVSYCCCSIFVLLKQPILTFVYYSSSLHLPASIKANFPTYIPSYYPTYFPTAKSGKAAVNTSVGAAADAKARKV